VGRVAMETLGDRVRVRRMLLGMSQEDAAAEADMSRTTWSRLENDEIDARLNTLQRVACALDMSLGELLDKLA